MLFTLKLAWRNLFRNKRRAIIAGTAIGVGLASMIFTDALIEGMLGQIIRSATASYLGEGQIHRRGFRLTQDAGLTVADAGKVQAELERDPDVEALAPRAAGFGMITSPTDVSSVLFVGVDPEREKRLSRVDENIREGAYFADANERDIVIGAGLAETLAVALGDRVVVTVAQAASGSLSQDMFRVSGIYRFGVQEMDNGFVFVRLAKAQEMFGVGDGIHEIALKFKDIGFATEDGNPFWERYSSGDNEAVSWATLLPQLRDVLGLFWISLAFMAAILFGVVAFGIINTLFMSLYERMFEFGVLRAVGTRPSGMRRLIVFEAGALAVLSIVIGAALGLVVTMIVAKTGVDYSGIEFAGTAFYEPLYPTLQARQFVVYPLATFLFTLLVALYPARVAGKLRIAEALRKSL